MLVRFLLRLAVLGFKSGRIESTVNLVLLLFIEMINVQNIARDALTIDEACAYTDRMEVPGARGRIPEEILQEIFSRMPYPEIVKIREVSKVWNTYFLNELKPNLPAIEPAVNEATPFSTWAKYCPYLYDNHMESMCFPWARYRQYMYENQLEIDSDSDAR